MGVQIYHNPRCSKSRQTFAILEERGITPEIILYLETPPTTDQLQTLLQLLGMNARDLLRTGEPAYKENNLKDPSLTEEQLLQFMHQHPKLIERPIVINGQKACIGRPPESVLDIL